MAPVQDDSRYLLSILTTNVILKLYLFSLSDNKMDNASSIEEQLLDMDSRTEKLKLKLQREIYKKISVYLREYVNRERSQKIILQKELVRVKGFLKENQEFRCKCSPVECTFCDKMFKILNTMKQHQRAVHGIFQRELRRLSRDRISMDPEYQLMDHQENGKESTWDPTF